MCEWASESVSPKLRLQVTFMFMVACASVHVHARDEHPALLLGRMGAASGVILHGRSLLFSVKLSLLVKQIVCSVTTSV